MPRKMIVLFGVDQRYYIGEIQQQQDMETYRCEEPIELYHAWQLCMVDQQMIDRETNRVVGLSREYMLLPIGTAKGALPLLRLIPVGWYDPDACGVGDNLRRLIQAAEERISSTPPKSGSIVRVGPENLATIQALTGKIKA